METAITKTDKGFISNNPILLANECSFETPQLAKLAEDILYYCKDYNEWKLKFDIILNKLEIKSKWNHF